MAITIPQQSVELQPLSLPGAAPLSDNGLGGLAHGLGVAADQMRAAQVEIDKKRNATRVFEAESRLADSERQMRTEQQARKGSDAYGVTDDVASWWETEPAKLSADLENETQRTLFAEAAARRREISLNAFSTHEANESNAAVNDATEARKVNAINYGAENFDDPAAVSQARNDLVESVAVQARFNGIPPDKAEAMRIDALTKLHSNVIENMAEGDPAAASAYFIAHKGEIAGSVHDALTAKLKAAKDITGAQRSADSIWARGLDETAALAAARKETEGQEREHTVALLKAQFAEQQAAVAEQQKVGVEGARGAFAQGGIRALSPSQVDLMERVSPSELRFMRGQTPQDQVQTNWDVYEKAVDSARANPVAFRDTFDPMTLRGDLNQAELDTLTKIKKDLSDNVPSSVLTVSALISTYMPEKDSESEVEKQQRGLFQRAASEAIEDEQKRLNRKLSQDEMTAIIDKKLIATTVSSPWYWRNNVKPRFAMKPEDYTSAWNDIDEGTRTKIEARFREQGYIAGGKPTIAEVARMVDWYTENTKVVE